MARILQIEDNEDIQNILFNLFSEEHEIIKPTLVPKESFCFKVKRLIWSS